MIRIVYADQSKRFPKLFGSMFEHRAAQFRDRLKWDVQVDENGHEIDEYDHMNPLYLIVEDEDGRHCGSMRFLPTTGNTMINDHFTEVTGGVTVKSPFIWECTRFCLAPDADRYTSRRVLLGTMEIGLRFDLQFFVGVFSRQMCRVYDRAGWAPVLVGEGQSGDDAVCAGLWPISESARMGLLARCSDIEAHEDTLQFDHENLAKRLTTKHAA